MFNRKQVLLLKNEVKSLERLIEEYLLHTSERPSIDYWSSPSSRMRVRLADLKEAKEEERRKNQLEREVREIVERVNQEKRAKKQESYASEFAREFKNTTSFVTDPKPESETK